MAFAVLSAGTCRPIVRAPTSGFRAITPREHRNRHRPETQRGLARRRHADHRRVRAHPAAQARRLSHDRGRRRGALCRQGALAAQPRRHLHPADPARDPPDAHGVGDPDHGVRRHRQRGRGAAAREQPDQALPAALQRAAARRQVVSLHRHPPRHRMAAARQAPRRARAGNEYFGPFASASAVNRTLNALQRAFPLRSCSDGVFATRTRPCLQYQIKRCTAPCVGRIDKAEYDAIVDEVRGFLGGRNREVQQALSQRMEQAAADLEFERAAVLRDRIRALTHIQSHQSISLPSIDEADIFAAHAEGGQVCVQVFFLRAGQNFGNRAYFPSHATRTRRAGRAVGLHRPVLRGAAGAQADPDQPRRRRARAAGKRAGDDGRPQGRDPPSQARRPEGRARPGRAQRPRGAGAAAWPSAARSASCSRAWRACSASTAPPERIEVYDNSHIQGTRADRRDDRRRARKASSKNAYRKFNIKTEGAAGDDFAMMREVLTPPLRPRAARRTPNATRSTGPTWC